MNNNFIIHIADPSKFLDQALSMFEKVAPKRNVVFLRERNLEFQLSSVDTNRVYYKNEDSDGYDKKIFDYISRSMGVIVHFLDDDYKRNLILNLPQKIPVVWFAWGPDLYVVPNMYRKLFGPLTYRLILNKNYHLKYILYSLCDLLNTSKILSDLQFLLGGRNNISKAIKAIERTNFVATVIPEEYELLRRAFDYRGSYINWNYCNFGNNLHLLNETVNGNKVLVGHSSWEINNHIDCFVALKRNNVKQDIVCPLSYGNKEYRDRLIVIGEKLFGSYFHPVNDFLSYQDYAKMLQSCSSAIMGQYCQQGMGTAVILLWQGTKLFLSVRNPMYSFFKRNRIHVFSIEKDLASEPTDKPLSQTQTKGNRLILQRLYGQQKLLANTKMLCDILEKHK